MIHVYIFVGIAGCFALTEATICRLDSDCAATECCYIKHQYLIVSKRDVLPLQPVDYNANKTGVCQSYKVLGNHCNTFEKLNGFCGCNDKIGLVCKFVPEPTTPSTLKRKIWVPGPGTFKCVHK